MSSILDILYVPMGYLIRFAYAITHNYLAAIIIFALVIEIILSPIQIKQQKNQIAQSKLQPKVRAITKKYEGRKDNASMQKKQQEIMELYQKENFSPYSGCLPMLIQFPVILCLYQVIINPLRYIGGISKDAIAILTEKIGALGVDLGVGQQVQVNIINYLHEHGTGDFVSDVPALDGAVLPTFKMGSFDLSQIPHIKEFNYLWIIPIFVFIGSYFSMKLIRRFTYQPPESADMQNSTSMKIMNLTMPLMSTWISFSVPAAVGCYWIFRNILSVVERYVISKIWPVPQLTEEEIRAAEREYGAKKKKSTQVKDPNKPPVRSLHRIDFDDEPLPPSVPEKDEDEETEKSALKEDSPIEIAPLKDDSKEDKPKKAKKKKE